MDAIFRQRAAAPFPVTVSTRVNVEQLPARRESTVDGALSVGVFEDWFETLSSETPDDSLLEAGAPTPVESMIHGFAEDFRKPARDWHET